MSTILDAMQGGFGDADRTAYRLETLHQQALFPPPPESLQRELDGITATLISRRSSQRGMALVFTSAAHGEGVSYVSYCVARHLAYLLDGHVVWIDASYLAPQPKLMNLKPSYRSLLLDPEQAVDLPADAGLTLVGHGDEDIRHTELLTCGNYERLLDLLRERYYFTIIDAPAILRAKETTHLSRFADGAIMVVEARRLKHEVVRHGLEQLRSQGGKIFGSVLNKRVHVVPEFLYRRL